MLQISDILDHIVIKQKTYADKLDDYLYSRNIDIKKDYLAFKSAVSEQDSLFSYSYTVEDLMEYTDNRHQINLMVRPNTGPSAILRFLSEDDIQDLLRKKRSQLVTQYVELNPYYRTLMGLPPMIMKEHKDDVLNSTYIFSPNEDLYYYMKEPVIGADISIPVHKWRPDQKALLTNYKFTEEEYRKYPYLKYIYRNIDIISLRDAEAYEIVWTDIRRNLKSGKLLPFIDNYRLMRRYYLQNYRSEWFEKTSEFYERLQCLTLFMGALYSTNSNYVVEKITSINLSLEEIYNIFESFGLPKFKFSMKYMNLLASKLSTLVYRKGTNINLEDISDLFHDITIFKYFLVKVVNPDYINSQDDTKKYTLKYIKTPLLVDDPYEYMDSADNILDFDDVANNDTKWGHPSILTERLTKDPDDDSFELGDYVSDPKLKTRILETDFSWAESKYIGMDNIVNLGWVSMKIATLYRWIIDNKKITERYKIRFETLDMDTNIFELMLYLQCLMFRKYKRKASLPDTLSTYFKIYTFKENIKLDDVKHVIVDSYTSNIARGFKDDGEPIAINEHLRNIVKNPNMRFSDFNYFIDAYIDRNGLDPRLKGVLAKMHHFDEYFSEEGLNYDSYYHPKNIVETTSDDEDIAKLRKEEYARRMSNKESTVRYNTRGETLDTFIDFVSNDNTRHKMYNNYSKFEANFNMLRLLYEVRSKITDIKDYEVVDSVIKTMVEGDKLTKMFSKKDGTKYTDLLEYLVSLNEQNTRFINRINELSADPENHLDAFDSEIVEVISLLREASMLNPDKHTHAEEALEYLQRLYTDAEVFKYLEQIIEFFKSYKQDLVSRGSIYILEDGDNIIHILDHLDGTTEFSDWDLGALYLMMSNFPTETLRELREILMPVYRVETGERLEIWLDEFKRFKEIASDGYRLT